MSQLIAVISTTPPPSVATTYQTDMGTATPALNILNVLSAIAPGNTVDNLMSRGSGNTVTYELNTSINQPDTNASGTEGVYSLGGSRFLHNFGANNTFLGNAVGNLTNSAGGSTVVGSVAGTSLDEAVNSTFIGYLSGSNVTDGNGNTIVGSLAGTSFDEGENNLLLGLGAGSNYSSTESDNILLLNDGVLGESGVIRIGQNANQTTCFVAGIAGVTLGTPVGFVNIQADGQLGVIASATPAWIDVLTTTETIVINTNYIADNAGLVTFSLPATASLGDTFRIAGGAAGGGWTVVPVNVNQAFRFGSLQTSGGGGGFIESNSPNDTLECLCTVAGVDTIWTVLSSSGNLLVN